MKGKSKVLLVLIAVCAALLFTGTTALADTTVDCPNGAECTTHAAAIDSTHYDTLEDALDAAAASTEQTIVILNDTTFATAKTIAEGITLTIDLNGKTVIASSAITNNGTLTIEDSTAKADDISGGSGAWKSSVNNAIINNGTLTIDGAKITTSGSITIAMRTNSSLVMESGTVTGAGYTIYSSSATANVAIKKGVINASSNLFSTKSPAMTVVIGEYGADDDTVIIGERLALNKLNLTIHCGDIKQFSGTYNPETMQINCKLRNTASLVLPAGYFLSEDRDEKGVYYTLAVLAEENAGAKIETAAGATDFYADAASAVAALQSGDKLTLLKEYDGTLKLDVAGVNIDLGGNRIGKLDINVYTPSDLPRGEMESISVSDGEIGELIASTDDSRYYYYLNLAENVTIENLDLKRAYAPYSEATLALMGTESPVYYFNNDEGVRCLTFGTTIALELSPDRTAYLAQDYTGDAILGVSVSGTIDLDGHTFTSSAEEVLTTDINQTLIVRNGSLVNNGGGDIVVTQIPSSAGEVINSELILENVEMVGTGTFGIVTHGNATDITVKLKNSSISGGPSVGIYFPSADSVLTIDNSDITAGTGIGIKGGTLNIIGDSNIHATGERRDPTTPEGSGINSTGDAIYVEANYGRETIVNIESGSFVSDNAEAVRMLFDESAPANQYEVEASGGEFSTPLLEEYLADDLKYELKSDKDTYSYYPTIGEAIDAATEQGGVISSVGQDPAATTHTVALDYDYRGLENLSVEVAHETEFTLPDATRSGYDLVGWEDEDGDTYDVGDEIEITRDREFTAIWEEIDEGEYRIRIVVTGNGSVESSDNYADEGDRITLTVDPDRGYELYSLTITDASGDRVSYRDRGDGEYTFTMPDSRVTVRAIFVEINEGLPFVDVASNAWYYDAVEYVYDNDLFEGMSAYIFGPNEPMNRGMLVTVLYRLEGEPRVNGDNNFSDVGDNLWYSDAVVWANSHGIVEGYNGSFRPLDNISREEMAAVIYRYAVYKGLDVVTLEENLGGFVDGSEVSDWAVQSMNWAVGQGVLHGKGANNLDPQGIATRAEVAQILMNYLER